MFRKIAAVFSALIVSIVCAHAAQPALTLHDVNQLWDEYFLNGKAETFDRILSCVDTEDELTVEINKQFKTFAEDVTLANILIGWGYQKNNDAFVFSGDAELVAGFLYQDSLTKVDADTVYSHLPEGLMSKAIIKTQVFWQVVSNAQQRQPLMLQLQKRLPLMHEQIRKEFYSALQMKEGVSVVTSSNGVADFSADGLAGKIILVEDLASVIEQWKTLSENETPHVKAVTKMTGNDIAPFIVFSLQKECQVPVYYDFELLASDGKTVLNSYYSLLFAQTRPPKASLLYTVKQAAGMRFEETDEKGLYYFRITVYSDSAVLSVVQLSFTY